MINDIQNSVMQPLSHSPYMVMRTALHTVQSVPRRQKEHVGWKDALVLNSHNVSYCNLCSRLMRGEDKVQSHVVLMNVSSIGHVARLHSHRQLLLQVPHTHTPTLVQCTVKSFASLRTGRGEYTHNT